MSILYYPHIFGETIYDCMDASKEFDTLDDLKEWVYQRHNTWLKKEDIVLGEEIFDDDRVGIEDARMVLVNKGGSPRCIGYCALKYDPLEIERSKLEVQEMLGEIQGKDYERLEELRIRSKDH